MKRGSRVTDVSVVVGGTEVLVVALVGGALACAAGSLIIIPVVRMAGFYARATLEDSSAAVLGRGRSVIFHVVGS